MLLRLWSTVMLAGNNPWLAETLSRQICAGQSFFEVMPDYITLLPPSDPRTSIPGVPKDKRELAHGSFVFALGLRSFGFCRV